jgi:hypothetical protein
MKERTSRTPTCTLKIKARSWQSFSRGDEEVEDRTSSPATGSPSVSVTFDGAAPAQWGGYIRVAGRRSAAQQRGFSRIGLRNVSIR